MKLSFFIIFALFISNGFSQENKITTASEMTEIPEEEYFVQKIHSDNSTKELPSLDYWGHKEILWHMEVEKLETPLLMKESNILGIVGTKRIHSNQFSKLVNSVSWSFELVNNRRDRFIYFTRLKNKLSDNYGESTESPYPPQAIGNSDAYVSNLLNKYMVKWSGGETDIILELNEETLTLTFSQSDNSSAEKLNSILKN